MTSSFQSKWTWCSLLSWRTSWQITVVQILTVGDYDSSFTTKFRSVSSKIWWSLPSGSKTWCSVHSQSNRSWCSIASILALCRTTSSLILSKHSCRNLSRSRRRETKPTLEKLKYLILCVFMYVMSLWFYYYIVVLVYMSIVIGPVTMSSRPNGVGLNTI